MTSRMTRRHVADPDDVERLPTQVVVDADGIWQKEENTEGLIVIIDYNWSGQNHALLRKYVNKCDGLIFNGFNGWSSFTRRVRALMRICEVDRAKFKMVAIDSFESPLWDWPAYINQSIDMHEPKPLICVPHGLTVNDIITMFGGLEFRKCVAEHKVHVGILVLRGKEGKDYVVIDILARHMRAGHKGVFGEWISQIVLGSIQAPIDSD